MVTDKSAESHTYKTILNSRDSEILPYRRWNSMRHHGRRPVGSNALASQLYRSSSFNSSGRNSNCDTEEDMYNDVSSEDVKDINYKIELLQKQLTDLVDFHNNAEDRTNRAQTEYAVLQTRYRVLEEQFREAEIRAEERLIEESKRYRELLSRVEREAALTNENSQIKTKTAEIELESLRSEIQRLRLLYDRQTNDLLNTEEKLEIAQGHINSLQNELSEAKDREIKLKQEKQSAADLLQELGKEFERLREECGQGLPTVSIEMLRLEEVHQEINDLKDKNKKLQEQNEELQATVLTGGVEEGRQLLNGTLNSLAQELEQMSHTQLQKVYQEKDDENQRLKHYIDTILLNIVENYPQLLEVKSGKVLKISK